MDRYQTDPRDAVANDWVQRGDLWFPKEPLVDRNTNLYARLCFEDAERAATLLGGVLVSPDDVQDLHDEAARGEAIGLVPITLPTPEMVVAAGYKGSLHDQVAYQAAAQTLRVAKMNGLEWAKIHDAHVADLLSAFPNFWEKRLANVGKHWVRISPEWPAKGRAYLMGWWNGSRFIQPKPLPGSFGPHGARDEYDYGTTTLIKRFTAP